MLRAVIIDDEDAGIITLDLMLKKHFTNIRTVATTTDAKEGIRLIEDYKPEVVFLDISMPVMNGFELLEQLQFRNFNLVFTTAHQEYALKAIKNNAFDYLLKPIDLDDLKITIDKIISKSTVQTLDPSLLSDLFPPAKNAISRIPIPTAEEIIYEAKENIVRLEAVSNYTRFYVLGDKKHMVSKTLGEYEKILCEEGSNFMRIHNSFIVNLQHVVRYSKDNGGQITTVDGVTIKVSRSKKDELLSKLRIG